MPFLRRLLFAAGVFVAASGFAEVNGADLLLQLAREAQAAGKPERALEYLDDLISRVPDFADGYYQRAQLRKTIGDEPGARADLDQVIALNPQVTSTYALRAKWRLAAADYSGAIADSLTGGNRPENVETRANARIALGQSAEALADITALRTERPLYTGLRYQEGLCLLALDRLADAARTFTTDFEDCSSTDARASLVLTYCIQADVTAAEKEVDDWIDATKQPEPAIDYDRVRWQALRDDVAMAHYLRGVIRFAQNDFAGAAEALAAVPTATNLGDYARLLRHTALLRAKQTDEDLAKSNEWENEWTQNLRKFLLGEISEKMLIDKAAEEKDIADRRRLQTEACFYAGEKRLIGGDEMTAALFFERAIAPHDAELSEYALAKVGLKSIK